MARHTNVGEAACLLWVCFKGHLDGKLRSHLTSLSGTHRRLRHGGANEVTVKILRSINNSQYYIAGLGKYPSTMIGCEGKWRMISDTWRQIRKFQWSYDSTLNAFDVYIKCPDMFLRRMDLLPKHWKMVAHGSVGSLSWPTGSYRTRDGPFIAVRDVLFKKTHSLEPVKISFRCCFG